MKLAPMLAAPQEVGTVPRGAGLEEEGVLDQGAGMVVGMRISSPLGHPRQLPLSPALRMVGEDVATR